MFRPELWFKRCDGRVFHYDQLTSANMNIQQNTIDINAGQDLFPVATLPGTSTCQLTCTLGNFDSSLFELSEAQNFAENTTYQSYETEKLVVATNKITIATAVTASSVSIAGMKEVTGTPAAEDEFKVTITAGTPGSTEIAFKESVFADGSEVVVSYTKTVTVKEIVVDNKASAIGTVVAKYPKHIWDIAA